MRLWFEAHHYECNDWAIHNSLQEWKLQLSEVLNFQEFLFDEENAVGLKAFGGQSACGTLNRYLLIFNRLIFESRVRPSSPSLPAAPARPQIRPFLSARPAP